MNRIFIATPTEKLQHNTWIELSDVFLPNKGFSCFYISQARNFILWLPSLKNKNVSCWWIITTRRGFNIRLKSLKPRDPAFRGPQNFGSKENLQYFCKQLYLYFCFGSTHVNFTMPLTKDLYRKMSAKGQSEWRWAFSFLALRIGYCYVLYVEKTPESIFQIRRGQWAGPAFCRLPPIGSRSKGDPALRLLSDAKLHFLSKLLVQCSRGAHNIFRRGAHCNENNI